MSGGDAHDPAAAFEAAGGDCVGGGGGNGVAGEDLVGAHDAAATAEAAVAVFGCGVSGVGSTGAGGVLGPEGCSGGSRPMGASVVAGRCWGQRVWVRVSKCESQCRYVAHR